jgi:hypothetical protein
MRPDALAKLIVMAEMENGSDHLTDEKDTRDAAPPGKQSYSVGANKIAMRRSTTTKATESAIP